MDSFLDYGNVQLFLAMMSAGWVVPEWLKHMAWERLQLVTLEIADRQTLPNVSEKTPVTIRHRPDPIQHILEKTVTLTVGKSRSFRFLDHSGDSVACYINRVTLIDVWNELEEQFNHPRYTEASHRNNCGRSNAIALKPWNKAVQRECVMSGLNTNAARI